MECVAPRLPKTVPGGPRSTLEGLWAPRHVPGFQDNRLVIAQLLASTGETESAELRAVRPLLAAAYGSESAQVRNLDKQIDRLQPAPGSTS